MAPKVTHNFSRSSPSFEQPRDVKTTDAKSAKSATPFYKLELPEIKPLAPLSLSLDQSRVRGPLPVNKDEVQLSPTLNSDHDVARGRPASEDISSSIAPDPMVSGAASLAESTQKAAWMRPTREVRYNKSGKRIPDGSKEAPFIIAFPFPKDPDGYSDPEGTDFAPQMLAELAPVRDAWNKDNPNEQIEFKPVDVYRAFDEGLIAFKKRIVASGLLKTAPPAIKNQILSWAGRRHAIENVEYKRQDRAHLEKMSHTAREYIANGGTPLDDAVIIDKKKQQETDRVLGGILYNHVTTTVLERSTAVAEKLRLGEEELSAEGEQHLPSGWTLKFEGRKQFETFFHQTFPGEKIPKVTEQARVNALAEKAAHLLSISETESIPRGEELDEVHRRGDNAAAWEARKTAARKKLQNFRSLSDLQNHLLANTRLTQQDLHVNDYDVMVGLTPLGDEVLKHAATFRQRIKDTEEGHRDTPKDFTLKFDESLNLPPEEYRFVNGMRGHDLSTEDESKYEIVSGDKGVRLEFSRRHEDTQYDVTLRISDADGERTLRHDDPNFQNALKARFPAPMLEIFFGGSDTSKLRNSGSFRSVLGRTFSGPEMKRDVLKSVRREVREKLDAIWEEEGDPVGFHGGGNSYNKTLYGRNWGNPARETVEEALFDKGDQGEVFNSGSCGHHQGLLAYYGYHIDAHQEGGRVYRYNDRGGDPYDDFKLTFMSVNLYTRTAGAREKKVRRADDEGWFARDVAGLTLPLSQSALKRFANLKEDPEGKIDEIVEGQFEPVIRDSEGLSLQFSEFLKVTGGVGLDGKEFKGGAIDPLSTHIVRLKEDTPANDKGELSWLKDDLGRPVNDGGRPVTQMESLTLVATLNDQPLTAELINAKRHELEQKARAAAKNDDPDTSKQAIKLEVKKRLRNGPAGMDRATVEATVREEFSARRERTIQENVEKGLCASIRYRAAQIERWARIPIWVTHKDGRIVVKDGRPVPLRDDHNQILYTYKKKIIDNPTQKDLRDSMVARIRSVHSQEGRVFPYTPQITLRPGLIVSGVGIPRGGENFDTPLGNGSRSTGHPAIAQAFGAYQEDMQLESSTVDAIEDEKGTKEMQQSHNDMGDADLRYRVVDDGEGGQKVIETMGEDPKATRLIQPGLAENSRSVSDGIVGTIRSGIGLRGRRTVQRELLQDLRNHKTSMERHPFVRKNNAAETGRKLEKMARTEAEQRRPPAADGTPVPKWTDTSKALADERNAIGRSAKQAVYGDRLKATPDLKPFVDKTPLHPVHLLQVKPDQIDRHPSPSKKGNEFRLRQFAAPGSTPLEAIAEFPELNPENHDVVAEAKQKIAEARALIHELIGELEDRRNGPAFNRDEIIERFFRSPKDRYRWGMTSETKAFSGDAIAVGAVGQGASSLAIGGHLAGSSGVFYGFDGVSMIGHAFLTAAAIEGTKNAGIELLRGGQLISALKKYQRVLQEADAAVNRHSGSAEADPSPVLRGVNARLKAAQRHFVDNCINATTSATLAGAGAAGLAGDALHAAEVALESHGLALPQLGLAADATGIAGGALVMGFGALTTAQAGLRLKELDDFENKVRKALNGAIDNAFGEAMLIMIGHQKKALKRELPVRVGLTALGGTSIGLGVAGTVGAAVDPTGASVASMLVGGATGVLAHLAFRQFLSRHRGLMTIPGVERTPALPVGYLNDLSQIADTVSMLNNELAIHEDHRKEMVEQDLRRPGNNLSDPAYMMRVHSLLGKVIPDGKQRYLMAQMRTRPQDVASTSHRFMLRMTEFQAQSLEFKVLPEVQKVHDRALARYRSIPEDDVAGRRACAAELSDASTLLLQETARLEKLKDLYPQLKEFNDHLRTDFLKDPDLKQRWQELRADFIIGHGMVGEALSRGNLGKINKQVKADPTLDQDQLIRQELLRKPLDTRFAKVFARWPDKHAYERNALLEIGLPMVNAILAESEAAASTQTDTAVVNGEGSVNGERRPEPERTSASNGGRPSTNAEPTGRGEVDESQVTRQKTPVPRKLRRLLTDRGWR